MNVSNYFSQSRPLESLLRTRSSLGFNANAKFRQNTSQKPLNNWKWTKRIGSALLCGISYQTIKSKFDENRYPPFGKMVDVGGYHLHLYCQGENGPSVILDSGLGCSSLEWSLIQPEIAKTARVYSYDRAGLGWSEESPLPRTSQNCVHELHTVLKKANIPGPYLLVGHSFGGLNMRLFANTYPEEVRGVVLVDSSHEDTVNHLSFSKMHEAIGMAVSYSGLARLIATIPSYKKTFEMFPRDVQEIYLTQSKTNKNLRTHLKEASYLKESSEQLKTSGGLLGDKPLIVISAGKELEYFTQEKRDIFKSLQKDLVTKSTQGKQIIAKESGHVVTREAPSVIIKAIQDLL